MGNQGLRGALGVGATPFSKGPYFWDQQLAFGGVLSSGLASGSSSSAIATSTDNFRGLGVYVNSSATVATNGVRGIYSRLWVSGAGGGGEAARLFTTINGVAADTANGAHITLSLADSSSMTGLGLGVRAQLQIGNSAPSGGTFAALQAEIYGDGASSSVSSMTECSFFRVVADGANAAIKATIDTSGYLFSIQGLTKGSGKLFQDNTAAAASQALRIKIGATPYYIMLTSTGA